MLSVCEPTPRQNFLESIRRQKAAGIREVQTLREARCIAAYRSDFIAGRAGERDGKRAAILMEATQLKNAESRVLSVHLALARMGWCVTMVPEEIIAAQVVSATGGLCSPRTYRAALASLCRKGWLYKSPCPTGTKAVVGYSGQNAVWKALRINRVMLTPASRAVIARAPLSDTSLPRQKVPAMGERENPENRTFVRSGSPEFSVKSKPQSQPSGASQGQSGKAVAPTSGPGTPVHVEQRSVGQPRKARETAKKAVCRFGRHSRNKCPGTWESSRKLLLHDLYCATKSDRLYAVADCQTDLAYPPLLPSVVQWETYVFGWTELDWKARRRIMLREIVPPLQAFAMAIRGPDPADLLPSADPKKRELARQLALSQKRLHFMLTALPETLSANVPEYLREKIAASSWSLKTIPWLLNTGKILLRDMRPGELQAFREIADATVYHD